MSSLDTTGKNQVRPFTRPTESDVVRGNDNKLRDSINQHDSDEEAHIGGASSFVHEFLFLGS